MKKFFMIAGCVLALGLLVLGFLPNAPGFGEDTSADRALANAQDVSVLVAVASNTDPISARVRREMNKDIAARD